MVAIGVAPGNSSAMVPADFQQLRMLRMKLQQHTFAADCANSFEVAVPSGDWIQADNQNGSLYFGYLKGILLLTFLFSALVLAVCITGQF